MAHLINKYSFPPEKDMLRSATLVDPISMSWYRDSMRTKHPEVTVSTVSKDKILTGTDILSAKLREALSVSRPRDLSPSHYSQYMSKNYADVNENVAINNLVNSAGNSGSANRNGQKLDLYGATDHKRSIAMNNDMTSFPSRTVDMKSGVAPPSYPVNNYMSTYASTYGSGGYGSKATTLTSSAVKDYKQISLVSSPPTRKEIDYVTNNSRPKTSSIPSRMSTSKSSLTGYDRIDYGSTNIKTPKANDEYYMRKLGEILNVHSGPLFTSNPSMVTDYMYVGGYKDAENWHMLRRIGITHVLNMAALRKSSYNPYPPQSGIVGYEAFDADDHEGYNVMQHFAKAKAFIDRARWSNGKVLVHCAMGVNRSGTMCCAYLMAEHKIPLIEAARKMKRARGTTLTNRGFQKQLVRYARQKNFLG